MRIVPAPLVPLGSLWFAGLLLVLWAAAMGIATSYETATTRLEALYEFYSSWWFEALLGLLAFNTLLSMLIRYRFKKQQTGFLLTHVGILVILGGGLMTRHLSIDGQVGVAEGQTVSQFSDRFQNAIYLIDHNRVDPDTRRAFEMAYDLDRAIYGGFNKVENPPAPPISFSGAEIEVLKYVPDSALVQELEASPGNDPPAARVVIEAGEQREVAWLRPGAPRQVAGLPVAFRRINDPALMKRLMGETTADDLRPRLVVKLAGEEFTIFADEARDAAVPLGETGYAVRVEDLLLNAKFAGDDLVNDPQGKRNPAARVAIERDGETEQRSVLAAFPGFGGDFAFPEVDVRLVAPEPAVQSLAPMEILRSPSGELVIRFDAGDGNAAATPIEVGRSLSLPGGPFSITVDQYLEHARMAARVVEVDPVRDEGLRTPAIQLEITTERGTHTEWLQKRSPRRLPTAPNIELLFMNKMYPLGFQLRLDDFHMGEYPGTRRPRSFASAVTFTNLETGEVENARISMNHPVTYGTAHSSIMNMLGLVPPSNRDYIFYQSSYQMQPQGPAISFFSVAWDPGRPVVYTGYFALLIGMLWMLAEKMWDRPKAGRQSTGDANGAA